MGTGANNAKPVLLLDDVLILKSSSFGSDAFGEYSLEDISRITEWK